MQRFKSAASSVKQLARRAAEQVGIWTQRSAIAVADNLQETGERLRQTESSQKLADTVLHAGEQVIDMSPLPVPLVVRDTLGRMQDALGQLGQTIDMQDAAKTDLSKSLLAEQKRKQHYTGKVAGLGAEAVVSASAQQTSHKAHGHKGSAHTKASR